jgi:hypothetical protein
MKNSTSSSRISERERQEWLAWAAELKPQFAAVEPILLEYDRSLTTDQRFDLLAGMLRDIAQMGIGYPDDLRRPWTHTERFLT